MRAHGLQTNEKWIFMEEIEWIDDYFNGRLSPANRYRFETALHRNASLVQTVVFYLSVREAARQTAQSIEKPLPVVQPVARWRWTTAAATVLLAFGLSVYFWMHSPTPTAPEIADRMLREDYYRLPTRLGGPTDSLTLGAAYYNRGKLKEAETVFEGILRREPNQPDALKLAGLVALRLRKYDQSIDRFHRLGQQTQLYANPGLLLEAVARLKRGQPMDKNQAKNLLRTVIQGNLEGKSTAEQLVNQL